MLDSEQTGGDTAAVTTEEPKKTTRRRRATKATAASPTPESAPEAPAAEASPAAKKATRRRRTAATAEADTASEATSGETAPKTKAAARSKTARKSGSAAKSESPAELEPAAKPEPAATTPSAADPADQAEKATRSPRARRAAAPPTLTFMAPPEPAPAPVAALAPVAAAAPAEEPAAPAKTTTRRRRTTSTATPDEQPAAAETAAPAADTAAQGDSESDDGGAEGTARRRRRGRRGRGRNGQHDGEDAAGADNAADEDEAAVPAESAAPTSDSEDADTESGDGGTSRRRRRRRRRSGSGEDGDSGRAPESGRAGDTDEDEVRGVKGSTRLEAKRQRRRDGRESGRRRPPILSEAEFLARRESVDRTMVVRQHGERTQIAVLEDDVLVEHYVTKATSTSYAGNVYLGRVQNVLPSMEAAFIDIGKGRNAVLYAGEVNWDEAGLGGRARSIEQALKSGDSVLVQVSKDPIGHKGARLTSQISLPGRYLVYVPGGSMTGISRKLPDVERTRLKNILRKIVPEDAGVIIRTAAEGASEEELTRDVTRLQAQWEALSARAEKEKGAAPTLLHAEPDLAIRVVRDIFNEDFTSMVVSGEDAWDTLEQYIGHVAPDLRDRLHRHTAESDVFGEYRIDEQLAKALDRKVWLPSGGSLVIDRTEAMVVIDVNTGRFTGQGGNLEETVTRNNLEAAEEIVRQLRLRDVGGIIVIDFIDMVLESNRELVLRRLTECLGRDRTRHQVAEVTSLGLVQMTRKRVGQGLLEAFSEPCEHCNGRGVIVHTEPVDTGRSRRSEPKQGEAKQGEGKRSGKSGRGGKQTEEAEEPAVAVDSTAIHAVAAATRGRGGRRRASSPAESPSTEETPATEEKPVTEEASATAEPVAVDETPVESAPVDETPVESAPAAETPAAEAPVVATPVVVTPSSAGETSAADSASADTTEALPAAEPVERPRRGRRRAAVREAGPPEHASVGVPE